MKLGYFVLGGEAIAFWESDHGDPRIDIDRATGRRHILCWRSDPKKPRPTTPEEIEALADELGLRPVTKDQWIEFLKTGEWAKAA